MTGTVLTHAGKMDSAPRNTVATVVSFISLSSWYTLPHAL
jgi:hypothetical protein